ncbi:ABC transporter ATP-binding protein [Paracoccaceae bacterium]
MSAPLLELRSLSVDAPARGGGAMRIVHDISFSLNRGEVLGLIGESGAGKSTIGMATMGAARGGAWIGGGQVMIEGADIMTAGPAFLRELRGRRVAYVAQSAAAAFNPAFRLIDQVIELSVDRGVMTEAEARARAIALFRRLELPSPETFGQKFPHQASGGQLQRAMTAMAMCARPELIVFDEPTTALDVTTQVEVMLAIRQAIREERMAALYISHDLAVVAQMVDRIMVLRHGRMIETGTAAQVLGAPQSPYTRQLIDARALRHDPVAEGDPLLKLSGVTAAYGNTVVAEGLDMVLPKRRTLAVIGESGSGKSTLGKVICGLLPPREGQLWFDGHDLPGEVRRRSIDDLRRIQLVHQIPDLAMNPRQRVAEIVGQPLTRFFGMKGAARAARVAELLQLVELDPALADRLPMGLSGGQKQRVCIARALAADPAMIVCDEVTSALDPLVADGVLKLLLRLQAEKGMSYLFITHDFSSVRAVADHVAVMRQGRIVRQGPTTQVLSPPFDSYTETLVQAVPELRIGWLDDLTAARAAALT